MATVELDRITKSFANGTRAVHALTLQVVEGERLVLLGPSGSGKTTILRLLAGLEQPTSGTIRIGGLLAQDIPIHDRKLGMVFQRPALYPHLSVRDNLLFGFRLRHRRSWFRSLRGASPAILAAESDRFTEITRILRLEPLLDRRPSQLSGGEQQRVALGRALMIQPTVLLLDEPLSSLDSLLRNEMRRELHLLHRRFPATMVYVTHDQVEAMTLADRVAVLNGGKLQQVGPPGVLYEQPANRFVARFLGWPSMSLLEGELVCRDDELCFAAGKDSLRVAASIRGDWEQYLGRKVTLGIRPAAMGLNKRPGRERLNMEVVMVENMGSSSLVTAHSADWKLTLESGFALRPAEGEWIEVNVDMEQAHLFDGVTGLVLSHGRPAG